MGTAQAVDYTLKPDYVSVITYDKDGVPEAFVLHSSHQMFKPLVNALKRKAWAKVPKLVTLARAVADQSEGNVEVKADGIYYKGTKVDNSLTRRIADIIKQNLPVKYMLKFMDNLYQNPQEFAIKELYDWLNGCNLPITDDGCFMAYKRVDSNFKDCYTHTIDNSPGQIVFMKRSDVDTNRHNTCSVGLHFCSRAYLSSYTGDRVVKVKINPKDVVSIPSDYSYTKGRTWMYEVIEEIPADKVDALLHGKDDIEEFQTAVYSIAKERRKLLADTLELPAVKRLIRRKKITKQNVRKMPYGRLAAFFKKFFTPEPTKIEAPKDTNRLKAIREAYGFTRGQVAEHMGVTYKQVYNAETAVNVSQDTMDNFLDAIMQASSRITALILSG